MLDRLEVARAGTHCGARYLEASKLHFSFAGLKYLWVEDDAIVAADVQPFDSLEEKFLNVVGPHKGVFYAFGLLREICNYFVKATTVSISKGDVSLWSNEVAVSARYGDEKARCLSLSSSGMLQYPFQATNTDFLV